MLLGEGVLHLVPIWTGLGADRGWELWEVSDPGIILSTKLTWVELCGISVITLQEVGPRERVDTDQALAPGRRPEATCQLLC